MKPASPVIPGMDLEETIYAKNQPQYQPLPCWKQEDGTILSRWKLTWKERVRVLLSGNVYLWVMTFNQPLQPVMLETKIDKEIKA